MTGERTHPNVLWALAGLTALGVAVRFATLGIQSYHHDEVITAARVIPGSFVHMLREVKGSESNPPLYYVLAWGWAKAFGTGEIGLRSLSALFGAATIPVAYLIGRDLASRRAGLITAALAAVNPMLIWYSQEARSYALLVFFGALSLLFFVRALQTRRGRDLALWALTSGLALCSHYFAVFSVAIEAAWLLVALRSQWRLVLPAVGAVLAVGLALLPLISAQVNPTHIGWIDHSPLSSRLLQTGVSFLVGETGHVIAEPPRERFALIPVALIAVALLLLVLRGSPRERRGGVLGLVVGLGVVLLAAGAALAGKDYIVERNLLPALMPLAAAVAVGFGTDGARRIGVVCAALLCAYWLAFDVHVARTPNLQRPDFRDLTEHLGPPRRPRAIVTWKLAADPIQFYLDGRSERVYSGKTPLHEIDVVSKPVVDDMPAGLPPGFRPVQRLRLERLTLTRYMSQHLQQVPFHVLRDARTGFGSNAVVVDGPAPGAPRSR
ncbi:MAG TPA: glycosyltransferase family 39 protein [Solirubrobacterales bacterium]|nr:glycosyltransferase family 39 protein [Solirubrobacterales bacterium]